MGLSVCAACGEPDCFEGLLLCEDALQMHAGVVTCSCDWGRGYPYVLTAVDPACPVHTVWGDDS